MALALSNKTSGASGTHNGTTASVAFANSKLYILSMAAHSSSGVFTWVAPVGGGLTWVQVKKTNDSADAAAVYCGFVDSGASTGTVALDCTNTNTNRLIWSIEEVTGSTGTATNNGSDAFGVTGTQPRTGGATSMSVTLTSFTNATNNAAFGVFYATGNQTIVKETGGVISYTNLGVRPQSIASLLTDYYIGEDTSVTATCTSATVCAIALELKAALGWGTGSWGDFPWGDPIAAPNSIGLPGIIDNSAVAFTPTKFSSNRNVGVGFINNAAVAFEPPTFVFGARTAYSTVNLRRGVRHGLVRGRGAFRASSRVRGMDGGSITHGYRVHGGPVPSRSAKQVTLGFINNAAVAFEPDAAGSVLMPLVDNRAVALDMSITHGQAIHSFAIINNAAVAFTPAIASFVLPLVDNSAVVFDMYIPIELAFINNAAVAIAPNFGTSAGTTHTVDLTSVTIIDNSAVAFQPEGVNAAQPQQVNLALVNNAAQAIQMFIGQEIPNAIILKASYDDVIELEGSFDDVILKKVKLLGTIAPIMIKDDWHLDEDQTFIWELPESINVTGWTTTFKLAISDGAPALLEYSGLVLSSTQVSTSIPAGDTAPLPPKKYKYEIARVDPGHHQVIARGDAHLLGRIV